MSIVDDAELLQAWRAGARGAGEQLVQRHFRTVYGFFRNKLDGDVEDLVQRTFLRCVEARDAFRGEASFRTYLLAIARNELFGHYRGRGVPLDPATTSFAVAAGGASPTELLGARQEQRLLVRALRSLPLDDQILLELFYFEQLTGPELARVLEVPEGTCRTRLRRARALLERALQELAQAGEALRATTDDLERWLGSLRELIRNERGA
ncbi:MAG: sigma-70 family RNA polymerase sigma factor [Nannocystaceae bacterium]